MDQCLYFAYGSNLNHEGMTRRCPDCVPIGRARLEDWQLTFRGVADIRRRRGAHTHGALWRISHPDLERLDRYEGYPSFYRREKVPLPSAGGELLAVTYVMRDQDQRLGLPSAGYLETIRQGYKQWGLPLIALDFAVAQVS